MASQPFKAGDLVRLAPGFTKQARTGAYEILRVMPPRETNEEQYRVRGPDNVERVVGQNEIIEKVSAPAQTAGEKAFK